jgi:hypothetical protein
MGVVALRLEGSVVKNPSATHGRGASSYNVRYSGLRRIDLDNAMVEE